MTTVFILSAIFIVYTYAIFPVLLHLKARNKPAIHAEEPKEWPTVSIVIAAHNEVRSLPIKFDSLEKLDYPQDKLEWIVVSDGSTDGTDALLKEAFAGHPDRRYKHLEKSLGKCGALNTGVALAKNEIILFMDARQRVSSNTVKKLVAFLAKDEIGAVSGELVLSDDTSLEAGNFGLYWRYEKWIRDNESKLFSTTGATGALYAIRRSDFKPNAVGTLLDDFNTPVEILKKGRRTVFVTGAYVFDKASDDIALEFRRKVRNLAGNWQSFQTHSWLFNPRKNPVFWQFISHKLFRLLVPYALIIAFLSAMFGEGLLMNLAFMAQVVFYAGAAASYANLPGTGNKVFNLFKVFVQLNAAAFIATLRFFINPKVISWR